MKRKRAPYVLSIIIYEFKRYSIKYILKCINISIDNTYAIECFKNIYNNYEEHLQLQREKCKTSKDKWLDQETRHFIIGQDKWGGWGGWGRRGGWRWWGWDGVGVVGWRVAVNVDEHWLQRNVINHREFHDIMEIIAYEIPQEDYKVAIELDSGKEIS